MKDKCTLGKARFIVNKASLRSGQPGICIWPRLGQGKSDLYWPLEINDLYWLMKGCSISCSGLVLLCSVIDQNWTLRMNQGEKTITRACNLQWKHNLHISLVLVVSCMYFTSFIHFKALNGFVYLNECSNILAQQILDFCKIPL